VWVRIPPRALNQIMPELPEVEIQVRLLRRQLRGAQIRAVRVRDRKLRFPSSLVGRRIERVLRRGKFIVFDLDNGRHLLAHLRMTGWFEFEEPVRYRVAIVTNRVTAFFSDDRRFGVLKEVSSRELAGVLDALGPDALLAGDLSGLRRTNRAVKVALLDQRLLAGIGNIYASESLWRAGIHPRRRADRLSTTELRRLRKGIVAALRRGIGYGPRIFEVQQFSVYDRAGKTCLRCGTVVRRFVQAQRSTFFCPGCQH
jgi:formamidopyrimidine-DNA glycosylase